MKTAPERLFLPNVYTLSTMEMKPEHQIRCVQTISIPAYSFVSGQNPMFDHLLESSQRDDSNKWSNIRFGEGIGIIEIKMRTFSWALRQA